MSGTWSFAQVGQDTAVLSLAASAGLQHPPFFVEVGANHPHHNSNTALLEQHGWHGVCIDASSATEELFAKSNRTCKFVRAAVLSPEAAARRGRALLGLTATDLRGGLLGQTIVTLELASRPNGSDALPLPPHKHGCGSTSSA